MCIGNLVNMPPRLSRAKRVKHTPPETQKARYIAVVCILNEGEMVRYYMVDLNKQSNQPTDESLLSKMRGLKNRCCDDLDCDLGSDGLKPLLDLDKHIAVQIQAISDWLVQVLIPDNYWTNTNLHIVPCCRLTFLPSKQSVVDDTEESDISALFSDEGSCEHSSPVHNTDPVSPCSSAHGEVDLG